VDTFTDVSRSQLQFAQSPDQNPVASVIQTDPARRGSVDMHRQSMASRSQFGQSSAQTATAQALRNKKKEYEAISALEQSCAELIVTLEDMATDLNTTAEATIGTIYSSNRPSNGAESCFWSLDSYREGDGTLDRHVPDS